VNNTNKLNCHCETAQKANETINKKRYSLKVQYIGKNYHGSQLQPNKNTIQGELEKAICTLINKKGKKKRRKEGRPDNVNLLDNSPSFPPYIFPSKNNRPIKTVFSGRTDAGVNALGQVVHFETVQPITNQKNIGSDTEKNKNLVASEFLYSLNEILPDDISVSDLEEVKFDFHAQKSARLRYYRYEFINRKCKNAYDGDLLRVKFPVDIERMQKSLNYLLGEHDFSSFKSSGTLNPSKICFIEKAEVQRQGDKIVIDIAGNRFLYNMVRAIVGTLLEIEGHNLEPEHMKNVLDSKNRTRAGKNVSPYGLTLMNVIY